MLVPHPSALPHGHKIQRTSQYQFGRSASLSQCGRNKESSTASTSTRCGSQSQMGPLKGALKIPQQERCLGWGYFVTLPAVSCSCISLMGSLMRFASLLLQLVYSCMPPFLLRDVGSRHCDRARADTSAECCMPKYVRLNECHPAHKHVLSMKP